MDYPKGYAGKELRINLNDRKISREEVDPTLPNKFIGGRGLNVKFLYDEVKPGIDPLGPDNKVFFGFGPCNGTSMSGSQRISVTAKSPLTYCLGDSNCGGNLGAELKYAEYDMLIIEGQSEKPVYLWIQDDRVEILDACLAIIGPGGENLVRFANIIMELGRAAGRIGMGAVHEGFSRVPENGTKTVQHASAQYLSRCCKIHKECFRNSGSSRKTFDEISEVEPLPDLHPWNSAPPLRVHSEKA